MAAVRAGLFLLVDPPEGQTAAIRDTLAAVDYPWHRLLPALRRDPDKAVVVRWDPQMQQGSTGLFHGSTYEIHIGTRYAGWEDNVPFVFAHETGHLVDRATLTDDDRRELTLLMHASDETYRRDDDRINGIPYDYAHTQPHNEEWRRRDKHYFLMLNEAYADLFVATFAPSLFPYVRFTHWTGDLSAVRDITLRRPMVPFSDIEGHAFQEDIEWAAGQGIALGGADGKFRPNEPVTRAQMMAFFRRALESARG